MLRLVPSPAHSFFLALCPPSLPILLLAFLRSSTPRSMRSSASSSTKCAAATRWSASCATSSRRLRRSSSQSTAQKWPWSRQHPTSRKCARLKPSLNSSSARFVCGREQNSRHFPWRAQGEYLLASLPRSLVLLCIFLIRFSVSFSHFLPSFAFSCLACLFYVPFFFTSLFSFSFFTFVYELSL